MSVSHDEAEATPAAPKVRKPRTPRLNGTSGPVPAPAHQQERLHEKESKNPRPDDGDDAGVIAIPTDDFRWMRVVLRGTSPMLQNRPREEAIQKIADKQENKVRGAKEARQPDRECIGAAHLCKGEYDVALFQKNAYGFPALAFKKALAAAGYRFGDEANKVSTLGSVFVHGQYDGLAPMFREVPDIEKMNQKAAVRVEDPGFKVAIPKKRDDFVKPPTGPATIAYRPAFYPWYVVLDIEHFNTHTTADKVIYCLKLAGKSIGIGSWRVEKAGDKGSFEVIQACHLDRRYYKQVSYS